MILAQPGTRLAILDTSDPADVLAYQALLPSGKRAVALLNTNTSTAETLTFHPARPLTGELRTWTYNAAGQNATNSTITQSQLGAGSVAHGITLPAESMVILETS